MRIFIVNVMFFLLMVTVNALANILPLNGQTTGEISNRLSVLFTPAGYVFAIWGVIYLLVGIWILRQLPKSRRDLPLYKLTHLPFVFSCLLNSAWIVLWHYEFFAWTVIVMIALLLTLISLYTKIEQTPYSLMDRLPFSIYLGWVSVATIANISYALKFYQWNGLGLSDIAWTIIMLFVATILAIAFQAKHHDLAYPLVFVWAFIGIAVKSKDTSQVVAFTALILAIFLFIRIVIQLPRNHFQK
ncbi:TspO/MBR family protein [Bacillus sp. REN10]|uniref:TspO/MBR family protein n=1 Tax=Bacillus sp. REN10 TaxID=2782541 RepID=UPI00193C8073|nr:TspO/MBR family protein [Bacillus sp. REN10]